MMGNLEYIARLLMTALEPAGIIIIALGAVISSAAAGIDLIHKAMNTYFNFRRRLSRAILLGLEFLVAGDIIKTVAIELDFTSVGVLASLVLIRTFLSFTLEAEISGRWPWQQKQSSVDEAG